MVRIEVSDRKGERTVELEGEGPFVIGRSSDNKIQVRDQMASRRHCQIVREGKGWKLVDLESSNGTNVNGSTINQHPLVPGDEIQIGDARMLFVVEAEEAGPDDDDDDGKQAVRRKRAGGGRRRRRTRRGAALNRADAASEDGEDGPGDDGGDEDPEPKLAVERPAEDADEPFDERKKTTRHRRTTGARRGRGGGGGGLPTPVLVGGAVVGLIILLVVISKFAGDDDPDVWNRQNLAEAEKKIADGDLDKAEGFLDQMRTPGAAVRADRDRLRENIKALRNARKASDQWAAVAGLPEGSVDQVKAKLDAVEAFLLAFGDSDKVSKAREEKGRLERLARAGVGPTRDHFSEARGRAREMMDRHRFAEAVRVWEDYRKEHPLKADDADQERTKVQAQAQQAFDRLVSEARSQKDGGDLEAARETLGRIVSSFGIKSHVDEAKRLLREEFR